MADKIKTIEIQTRPFFEKLKENGVDMWQMLRLMIKPEKQLILFLDDDGHTLAQYVLPTSVERLEEDRKTFAQLFKQKLNN